MKKILLIFVLLGLYLNHQHQEKNVSEDSNFAVIPVAVENTQLTDSKYKCDDRTLCSQMNSYEEAKFFLDNCSKKKMDGDHDGIPCEKQF